MSLLTKENYSKYNTWKTLNKVVLSNLYIRNIYDNPQYLQYFDKKHKKSLKKFLKKIIINHGMDYLIYYLI